MPAKRRSGSGRLQLSPESGRKLRRACFFAESLERRVFLSAVSLQTNSTGVSGSLLQLAQNAAAAPVVGAPQSSSIGSLLFDKTGRVAVRITASDVAALAAPLANLGFIQAAAAPALHFVEGYLPVRAISSINNLTADGLMGVLPIYKPLTNAGSVDSEGDAIVEADRTRAATGNTGAGVTVGVLSDSFNNLGTAAADVASGDLPANVNVLEDDTGGATDEGRAMLQIVHDVAPGANLAFATADISEADFAQNIINLAKPVAQGGAGANIITDDITYLDEPFYQDGPIAQAVNTAVTTYNAAYFVSAGNYDTQAYESANVHFFNTTIGGISPGQSSYYNFNPSGTANAKQRLTLAAGQGLAMILQWDQPFFTVSGVTTNLNFYLLNHTTGAVVASATDNTVLEQEPIQFLQFANTSNASATFDLVINKSSGPTPGRLKYVNYGSNNFGDVTFNTFATNSPTIVPHAAAANAMAVAAAPFYNQRNFESFESEGPATILFDASGNRLDSAQVCAKPDITAPDGVDNTILGSDVEQDGFPNFFGTSAAGPHAAGVAALIKAANPSWTPAQIYADMKATADPNIGGTPGNPNFVGAGLIDAYRAVVGAPVAASAGVSDGFESGFLNQNWQTYTSGTGRSEVLPGNAPSSGSFQLIEDGNLTEGLAFNVPQLSEATLHVNLASVSNAALIFDEKSFANNFETTQTMPAMFIGHGNYDGVSMSVDGVHWYLVHQLNTSSSTTAYQTFTANLSAIAAANGITLTSDTQIKFQHYDPLSLTVPDGAFAFDNIKVGLALNLSGPAFYLKLDGDPQHLDIWNNSTGTGPVDQSILLSQVITMAVIGTGPSESLTIDFTAGDPLLPSGLSYVAGAGTSVLGIIGDNNNDTFNVTDTNVSLTSNFGTVPIAYSGVSVISLTGGTGNDVFTQAAQPGNSATLTIAGGVGNDMLNVNAGTFTFATDAQTGTQNLTINVATGASVVMNASQHITALNLNGGAASLASGGSLVLVTGTIIASGNGQLDLADDSLIATGMTANSVRLLLTSGYAAGAWTGPGIRSSVAATHSGTGIAYGTAASLFPSLPATFAGQTVNSGTAILARYTLLSDANQDHVVNLLDLNALATNFGTTGATTATGDFDYSGTVDMADFNLLAMLFNTSLLAPDPIPAVLPANAATNTLFSDQKVISDDPDLQSVIS